MRSFASFALLPIFVLSACGGDSEFNSSDREDESIAFDDVPAEFAAAQCGLYRRCATIYYDIVFSLEDCQVLLEEQIRQGGWGQIEQAVDGERVTYDANSARTCFDAIDAIDTTEECADANTRPLHDACETVLTGSVEAGGECDINDECEPGLICNTNLACPGECSPRLPAGDPCQGDDQCATTLVCSNVTQLCVEPGAEGEACGGGIEAQCDGGLACLGEDQMQMQTGICRPFDEIALVGEDAPCDLEAGTLCDTGLSCVVVSLDGPAFACRRIPVSGGTCGIGFPENCPKGEYCPITAVELLTGTLEGSCIELPAEGETCAARLIDGSPRCEAYARCNAATGTCLALRDLGESCSSPEACYSGNCENGGCAPARACP